MRQTRRPLRREALVLALALLAASCGEDDGQARTVQVTTTSTTEAEAPAETVVDSTDTTTTTEAAAPTEMGSVVVTLQDLPAGWTVSPPEEEEEGDDEICQDQDPFNAVEPVEEAESTFQQSDFGPFLVSLAGRYASTEDARAVLDALAAAVDVCQTFTEVDDDGTETTYTFTALSFPEVGDDTYAARLSASSPLGPLALDFAFAREGDAVAAIINGGLGSAETALTESMLRLMVDRL